LTIRVCGCGWCRERGEMPLSGLGRRKTGSAIATLEYEEVWVFPEDKEIRDPVHARLAKCVAEKASSSFRWLDQQREQLKQQREQQQREKQVGV
jgi:hypothetical protein